MRHQGLVPPVFIQPQLQQNIQVDKLTRRQDPNLPQPFVRQAGLGLPAVSEAVSDRRRQEPNDVAQTGINPKQPVGRQEVAVLPASNENQGEYA